jgi:uncharacterized protein YjlB
MPKAGSARRRRIGLSQQALRQVFARDRVRGIPNSDLPFLLWKDRLPRDARSGEAACQLFEHNGWTGSWIYTVYPFWHFHTRGHEVLACVAGEAVLGFGGDTGITASMQVGDVCVVPAGVGHKRVSASIDFRVAGAYPPGQEGDINSAGDLPDEVVEAALAKVALPQTDPITGETMTDWFGVK